MIKIKEDICISEEEKNILEKEAKEYANDPDKWIKDRYYLEIPEN